MSSYIENNLGPGETVIMKAKFSLWALVPQAIGTIIRIVLLLAMDYLKEILTFIPEFFFSIFTILLVIGIITVIFPILKILNTHLVITNKRVIGKIGLLSIKNIDYPIEQVNNVELSANFWGNIFHYYDLSVRSSGSSFSDSNISFTGISNAVELKNHVTFAIEQHAEEARRLQAEEIARAMMASKSSTADGE